MPSRKPAVLLGLFVVFSVAVGARAKFTSVYSAPGAKGLTLVGQKVIALALVDDEPLRMSAEESLASELTMRGATAQAAYRMIPREEVRDAARAKAWFERAGTKGVVIMRLVDATRETQKAGAVAYSSGPYASFWDYYPYGWSTTIVITPERTVTTITVETLVFDVPGNRLLWAGTSEKTNPKDVRSFVTELVSEAAAEMRKAGLTAK